MKVTSRPAISIAPAPAPPCRSLTPEPEQRTEADLPRAAISLGNDLGFSVASKRLALRRSALLCQENNLSEVMQSKLSYLLPVGHPISGYLREQRSKVLPLHPRKIHQYRTLAEADLERSQLTPQDQFEAHDLDELLLGELCQQLQRYPIARAELVKKTLRFFPEQPLYILLVRPVADMAEQQLSLIESTLGTQIAQELCFSRELLVCLTGETEPHLIDRIQAKSSGNLLNIED